MNVRLTWTLPTPTARQRPIDHVRIEGRVEGSPEWAELNQVKAPGAELTLEDIAPGAWEFRGIVVDAGERESEPREAGVNVTFDDPSPLTGFSAEVVD